MIVVSDCCTIRVRYSESSVITHVNSSLSDGGHVLFNTTRCPAVKFMVITVALHGLCFCCGDTRHCD